MSHHSDFSHLFEAIKQRQRNSGVWTGLTKDDLGMEGKENYVFGNFGEGFAFELRNYQRAAVKWMLKREKDYMELVSTPVGEMALPKGGILADEMGLGKTLEMLSLIASHTRIHEAKTEEAEPVYESEEEIPLSKRRSQKGPKKKEAPEIFNLENGMLDKPTVPSPRNNIRAKRGAKATVSRLSQQRSLKAEQTEDSLFVNGQSHDEKQKNPAEMSSALKLECEETRPSSANGGETEENKRTRATRKRRSSPTPIPDIGNEVEVKALDVPSLGNIRLASSGTSQSPLASVDSSFASPGKRGRGSCKECSRDLTMPFTGQVDSVANSWRSSKDKMKKSIQSTIDRVCGTSLNDCRLCVSRERSRATREAREEYLSAQLAAYSVTKKAVPSPTQKVALHCICGGNSEEKITVECPNCKKYQHPKCMNYDMKDPLRGKYLCPVCRAKEPTLLSKGTLIVTPASISYQWIEEFEKHVKKMKLKMLVYKGVGIHGYLQPLCLSSFDIVITTYEVLRKELYYANVKTDLGLRRRSSSNIPTYMSTPTPLTSIEWWRVCLDEAQMVEGEATRAAEMARKLKCVNRWCVTGTPIQKSIKDLSGLLSFLGINQIDPHFFISFIPTRDLDTLVDILAPVLWRTMKRDVLDQVHLPPQNEVIHWLKFSPVEEHFYYIQDTQCSAAAMRKFEMFGHMDRTLSSIDRHTLNGLLQPLLRLRHACCHPQMVRGEFINLNKSIMTMEQLLEQLIKKTTVECEDIQRILVSSLNGLAGLAIIREDWEIAAEKYREVLRIEGEMKDKVKMDTLQRLHAVHNLNELLSAGHKIPPTLRDSELGIEAEELKKHYMRHHLNLIEAASCALSEMTTRIAELSGNKDWKATPHWWLDALEFCETNGIGQMCVREVKTQMREKLKQSYGGGDAMSALNAFKDTSGLQMLLHSRIEELTEQRKVCLADMRKLQVMPLDGLAKGTADCHLRPTQRSRKKKCFICVVHEKLIDLESLIFRMDERKEDESENEAELENNEGVIEGLRKGTWHDSEVLIMIKALAGFLKKKKAPEQLIEASQTHVKIVDCVRKEFLRLRKLWRFLNDQASAHDELQMATLRLRLRLPGESLPPPANRTAAVMRTREDGREESRAKIMETIHIIDAYEVDIQKSKLEADLTVARNNLKKKLGKLLYLKSLQQAGYGKRGAVNPDPCPICQVSLGNKWSVLLCGHGYCIDCLRALKDRNPHSFSPNPSLACPYCRQMCFYSDISYVYTGAVDEGTETTIEVKGSHSTKVEAAVREMLALSEKEPESKTLIFSTWEANLTIISKALSMNGIEHCFLGTNKFQENLHRFKHDPNVKALLLPVHSGANGLNLIEANHVFLFEPIINPASELQAIGRVHRIGQTRQTLVHRFLVRGTVEENMHKMLSKHYSTVEETNPNENPVTIGELYELFRKNGQEGQE